MAKENKRGPNGSPCCSPVSLNKMEEVFWTRRGERGDSVACAQFKRCGANS